nr:LysR family transcriptional regulator [Pseudosulfitobacter pseudonitzschiae]
MEMNQIRYFLAVCEHRNFTHAASASNVSQPSLTTAIKKLEDEELGGELFVRDRAGCRLTALGKLMQPRLRKAHDETRQAKAEAVRHMRLERVPSLSVSAKRLATTEFRQLWSVCAIACRKPKSN